MELVYPLKFSEETITNIEFKRPKQKLIRKLGYPFALKEDGEIRLFPDIVARYISELAALPMSVVDEMDAEDVLSASVEIASFFGRGRQMAG